MAKRSLLAACAATLLAASLGGCAHLPGGVGLSEQECMARAMYFESNRSSDDGMLAVGTVVMNRVQSPKYPKSVCAVVGQPRQFADGVLTRQPNKRHSSWARAERAASAVLAGGRHAGVGGAMFFHTAGYSFPYRNMRYVTLAGGNIFYEKRNPAPGTAWPSANAFASAYSGGRSEPLQLAQADVDDASERPRRASVPASRPRQIALARMEDSGIERPYGGPIGARSRPVVMARMEESGVERSGAAAIQARSRAEDPPMPLASAPRPAPAASGLPRREAAAPLILASAPAPGRQAPAGPGPLVLASAAEPKARPGSLSIAAIIAMDERRPVLR